MQIFYLIIFQVYETKDDPRHVIDITRYLRNEILIPITKKLIEPHPNTYTYSKRLAEVLVANEADNINVAIVRPSIGKFLFTIYFIHYKRAENLWADKYGLL